MNCKDCVRCIHYELCKILAENNVIDMDPPSCCRSFRSNTTNFELPCKAGDLVYCIYDNKICQAQVLAYYTDMVGTLVELKISLNGELPTSPSSINKISKNDYTIKDVYLSVEDAENALKGGEE